VLLVNELPIQVICDKKPSTQSEESSTPKSSKSNKLSSVQENGTLILSSKAKQTKQSKQPPNTTSSTLPSSSTITALGANSSPSSNTPSIIKFISKMSNKPVICRIESAEPMKDETVESKKLTIQTSSETVKPTTPSSGIAEKRGNLYNKND
jgi:hypothetical protein